MEHTTVPRYSTGGSLGALLYNYTSHHLPRTMIYNARTYYSINIETVFTESYQKVLSLALHSIMHFCECAVVSQYTVRLHYCIAELCTLQSFALLDLSNGSIVLSTNIMNI